MDPGGDSFTYEKEGLSEVLFNEVELRTVKKQECVTSVFICLGLVALIGAIVILCDGYKGAYLGPSAIITRPLYRGYRLCLSSSI